MMEEDDIDLETLQARIDMSLAFTDNLVASWMQTTKGKLPPARSHADDERELQEHMRRPPRLGVGASVPESTSVLSRDSARLKYRLTAANGKKRARDDEAGPAAVSDDEDESRGRAIKKKVKKDPFGDGAGHKKKKKHADALDVSKAHEESARAKSAGEHEDGEGMRIALPEAQKDVRDDVQPMPTPKKKKHKKHKSAEKVGLSSPVASSSTLSASVEHPKKAVSPTRARSASDASNSPVSPVSASSSHSRPNAGSATNIPLLNLDGPPSAVSDAMDISPKKKRRRRKKKKALGNAATVDGADV